MLITSFYQVAFAIILFLSMRDHPAVKYHLGFLNGALSKAFFLLFASLMVSPLSYNDNKPSTPENDAGIKQGKAFESILLTASYTLGVVAVI